LWALAHSAAWIQSQITRNECGASQSLWQGDKIYLEESVIKKRGRPGLPLDAHKVGRREMTGETATVRTENG
jgi:hypothetical protein